MRVEKDVSWLRQRLLIARLAVLSIKYFTCFYRAALVTVCILCLCYLYIYTGQTAERGRGLFGIQISQLLCSYKSCLYGETW